MLKILYLGFVSYIFIILVYLFLKLKRMTYITKKLNNMDLSVVKDTRKTQNQCEEHVLRLCFTVAVTFLHRVTSLQHDTIISLKIVK